VSADGPHEFIPYGHQWVTDDDIAAVTDVLRSEFLTRGPAIERFERAVAEFCGVEHAVAVSNGTAALHLAVMAMGLGPGGMLWTVPNTFVASANCARYVGASVDFVDIDSATLTMDVGALEDKLAKTEAEGGVLPSVIVPVDFGGLPCDLAPIRELADSYGFKVLEDAAHSLGGSYRGTPVGGCDLSDAATFSFHPVKTITSGEGGMIVTDDARLAETVRMLRTHGITRDPSSLTTPSPGGWYYEQTELGFNYRMTDIQAALGASQMTRLDSFVARRNGLAARYRELLAGLPLTWQSGREGDVSAHHLFVIRLAEDAPPRGTVFEQLRDAGIGVNVHYIPVHLQPYYQALGFGPGDFPQAEAYYDGAITLPLFPQMIEEQQDRVVDVLSRAIRQAP